MSLPHDIRHAVRLIHKAPWFTAASVVVLGGGLKLTAIGVALGLAASAALGRSLATLLFGVPPLDPLTFVVAPLMLTLVALTACLVPAIRALRADPVAALRAD